MPKVKLRVVSASLAVILGVFAYSSVPQQTGNEELKPGENVLWVDPGDPSLRDFQHGIGGREGQPKAPFVFVSEDRLGTTAKINVRDARGATWNVKWGDEASPSTFCTRLLWACGYFVQTEYFVPRGRIEGAHGLKRSKAFVSSDGSFENARFQLRSAFPKYLDGQGWTWTENPFVDSTELRGLKILMLLVSNWDAKDARNTATDPDGRRRLDSNLSIFADDSTGLRRYLYVEDDWGASLGKWGNYFERSKWDCEGFSKQTPVFVSQLDGSLEWGFEGKHRRDLITDIRASDVRWLWNYLGRITDEQIRQGLITSGANSQQADCYALALRQRIDQLRQIADNAARAE